MADRIIAVIPARKGSKRLPKKNIRMLGDRPLIGYSILVAQHTRLIDAICVATDDLDVSDIALNRYSTDMVVTLPDGLTQDANSLSGVLKFVAQQNLSDWIVLLQPTCPLRQPSLVNRWIQTVLSTPNCSGGLTVDRGGYKLGYCDMRGFYTPDYVPMSPKQANRPHWARENGVFYMFKTSNVLRGEPFRGQLVPLECPPEQSIANIDTYLDWDITEFLLRQKHYDLMYQSLEA
jgi:CMP-N-acetylneuraminic acid synthetase